MSVNFGRYSGVAIIPAHELVQSPAHIVNILEENSMRAMDIPSDLIFKMEIERNRTPRWQHYPAKTLTGSSKRIRKGRRM